VSTANDADHAPAASTHWRLDASASTAEFRVPHFWGLVKVKGHFERLDGRLDVGADGEQQMQLSIDATSLQTGNRKRDTHLRSAEFFDCEQHPEVTFRSTRVSDAGDGRLRVDGELEAAGKRVPLAFDASMRQADDHLELEATTTVDQRLLDMTWSPLGMTRTPATLSVHARLRRAG